MTHSEPQHPLYPLRFEPIYQSRLWGGRRLAEVLSARLPGDGPIGEAWGSVSSAAFAQTAGFSSSSAIVRSCAFFRCAGSDLRQSKDAA